MTFEQKQWLPQLINSVPIEARKNQTSLYTIALEGWRRGMKLSFYNYSLDNRFLIRFSLDYNGHIHHFNGSRGDYVTEEAIEICDNKGETNYYLDKANVPIPHGETFGPDIDIEEMVAYAKKLKYPLVVKPTDGSSGKGVMANINNEMQLREAIEYVRDYLKFREVIIQEYVVGDEVRVYVLEGKVLGAFNRRFANVIGDGKSTIRKLIHEKNDFRKQIPHLYYRLIKIDKDLKQNLDNVGYTIDSIPKAGERVFLRKISNTAKGGDPYDVTDQLSENQKDVAIRAAAAIPGLPHCGVDMIINDEKDTATILEVNTRPGIGSHLFPIEGVARDVPKQIIDYYFPESSHISTRDANIYFDIRTILNSLKGRSTSKIDVPVIESMRIHAKRYKVYGDLPPVRYHRFLQKHAFEEKIHGFVKKFEEGIIEVVVASPDKEKVDTFKEVLKSGKAGAFIKSIGEEEWNQPVKLGFEFQDGINTMSVREVEHNLDELEKEMKMIQKENARLKKRIRQIRESRTWRLFNPIRIVKNISK